MTIPVGIGARRIARQILSFWKDLAIHFSSDPGKSEGCRQMEARAGVRGAPPSGAARGAAPQAASPDKSFRCG
ncbi:MAG: hypothetical protein ABR970_20885, partial [Roseiarcus sp.]